MSDYETAQRRRNIIVGLFVFLGLCAVTWLIFKFGDLPSIASKVNSFEMFVQFPTAPGVEKNTPVRFCGYQIGRVARVMSPEVRRDRKTNKEYHQAVVVISIDRKYVNIPSDVEVKLMTRGLGSSYIELKINPDKPPAPIDPNHPEKQFLYNGILLQGSTGMTSEFFPEESQKKLEILVEGIGQFVKNANDIIGDAQNKQNLKSTLTNLSQASEKLTKAIEQATTMMDDARKTLEEYKSLAATGNATLKDFDAKADKLVTAMVATSEELGKAASQLRVALEKVNAGDGTAGKLVNDARLYESLLESAEELQALMKHIQSLIDKINEKGLRSVY